MLKYSKWLELLHYLILFFLRYCRTKIILFKEDITWHCTVIYLYLSHFLSLVILIFQKIIFWMSNVFSLEVKRFYWKGVHLNNCRSAGPVRMHWMHPRNVLSKLRHDCPTRKLFSSVLLCWQCIHSHPYWWSNRWRVSHRSLLPRGNPHGYSLWPRLLHRHHPQLCVWHLSGR